jgi:hypothetical protein
VEEPGDVATVLYFVRGDRLVRVTRRASTRPTVDKQLDDLLAGPNEVESDAGLSSALAGTARFGRATRAGSVVTIELVHGEPDAGRSDTVLAFGQIVCTLASRPDVTGVAFERDGERRGVPRGDGSLSEMPLTAADYAHITAGP